MPHTRAEVAGIHWYRYFEWLHFRLPALALNIPPRCALLRLSVLGYLEFCLMAQNLRVGAGCHAHPR